MRFLLDHGVSGPQIGARLRARGHDVRALDQEPEREGLADDEVLRLAAAEQRVLVSFDKDDFPRLLREFAERGESHAGAIVLVELRSRDFDLVVRAIERKLAVHGREEDDWRDRSVFASPADLA